jgi:hypothetical protein
MGGEVANARAQPRLAGQAKRPAYTLPYSKLRVTALKRRLKSENDVAFGYSCLGQSIRDPFLCFIVLNPDLAVLDVQMHHAAVNPFLSVPPDINHLEMALDRIDDHLDLNLTVARFIMMHIPAKCLESTHHSESVYPFGETLRLRIINDEINGSAVIVQPSFIKPCLTASWNKSRVGIIRFPWSPTIHLTITRSI